MKNFRLSILLLFLALALLPTEAPCESRDTLRLHFKPPESVLFTGNSLTFYNNSIYTHLRRLLVAEDPAAREKILLKSMTISGAVLAEHRDGLQQMLESRSWDVIVLQGHSREAIDPAMLPGFRTALEDSSGRIRSSGSEPVLFMTWAYSDRPQMTAELNSIYSRLGKEFDMMVIPVGLAFEKAGVKLNGVRLHTDDTVHPSLAGTYLAAAVFYCALYGKSPEKLGYDAGLDAELARSLRQVAWQTVLDYNSQATEPDTP